MDELSFLKCRFHVEDGKFRLNTCEVVNCTLHFTGPAQTIVRLMDLFYPDKKLIAEEQNIQFILLDPDQRGPTFE